MYELKTAFSYLLPRKGQLSSSVVGLIAVIVITAICWLLLVFFSTTEGFERRWSEKIADILGPMQITPSAAYFDSTYYQSDLPEESRLTQKVLISEEHPLSTISEHLTRLDIPHRPFESTVCHITIPVLQASPNKSLSQYSSLIGFTKITELPLIEEMSITEVDRLLSLLAQPKTRPFLQSLIHSIENLEVITTENIDTCPSGQKAKASIDDSSITLTFPSSKTCTIAFSATLPFATIRFTLKQPPLALSDNTLRAVPGLGYPILLSKQMRKQGARLFDTGTFEFQGASFSGTEQMTIPFYIAGFFDPGILPIGSKLTITSLQAVQTIQPELTTDGPLNTSGLVIDLPLDNSLHKKQKEIASIIQETAPHLFSIKRYDQYETTTELFMQLTSERTLFRLISIIIIAVACSNIFSMLFILSHDRRKEIAIHRALGSSKTSIATIFIVAGLIMGLLGSALGSALAAITLHYLPELLALIGQLQGHELLQSAFYGEITETHLSISTLLFSLVSISLTSAFAGALAAIRACRINVSQALRG